VGIQAITAWNHEKTPEFSPRNPGKILEIPEIPGNSEKPPPFYGRTPGTPFPVFVDYTITTTFILYHTGYYVKMHGYRW
jgi:hypothetical protein